MIINVKDKMIEKKLNKNQFAKLVQIGYPAACAIYDGSTTRISFDTLESICRVLDCTPNDIFTSDEPKVNKLLVEYNKIVKLNKKNGAAF